MKKLIIKVDVDTDRGTRVGVPNLVRLFKAYHVPATFLFSLGPDNTGRALKRIFRPGFFKKVSRTNVIGIYGLRTLMNGVLLPGPHIGRCNQRAMRDAKGQGFEVGIHCYDHIRWQDGLHRMSREAVMQEFQKARDEFQRIFSEPAKTAGAAGWQANADSLHAYDQANLLYASDVRGGNPFFPRVGEEVFKTLQIPSTMPTLDEVLGRPEYPESTLIKYFCSLLTEEVNVLTVHAEIEGMRYLAWFRDFLQQVSRMDIEHQNMADYARELLADRDKIPVNILSQGEIEGRSGRVAIQNI